MIGRLSAAFALAWAGTSMVVGPGGAALVRLTGDDDMAGAFVAIFYVGAALGSWVGGMLMDRIGRKPVVLGGYILATAAYAGAGWAERTGRLVPFCVLAGLVAAGAGALTLGRLAIAESVAPQRRGRALAVLQVAATAGAVVGPLLLIASPWLPLPGGVSPLAAVWWVAPPLLALGGLLVWSVRDWPRWAPPQDLGAAAATVPIPPVAPGQGLSAAAEAKDARGGIWPAVVTLVLVQAAMVAVMGVAGAVVVHAGHGADTIGAVVLLHFAGMFALSLLVGRFADRHGRVASILVGWVLLGLGGLLVALVGGMVGFAAGLMVAGLGWSFAYLGATALFADRAPAHARARMLGRTDLASSLLAAATAMGAGVLFARQGLAALGFACAALALVGASLVLGTRRRPRPLPPHPA